MTKLTASEKIQTVEDTLGQIIDETTRIQWSVGSTSQELFQAIARMREAKGWLRDAREREMSSLY